MFERAEKMKIAQRKVGAVGGLKFPSQKIPIKLGSELRCEALYCHGLLDHGSLLILYSTDLGTSGKSFERVLMVKRLFSRIFASTEVTILSVIKMGDPSGNHHGRCRGQL
ncbi:hypothetical protein AVEN_241149-1 [Araneus ventricosus]|uniref:Uncharacterized protein n=1 Tax=Araneus ventricosus TaxID=182803 RepID=A0A4Y2SGH6_ARAVE|nr:hypothetical protein AVEN_95077-1 [Araneus ventricosus]GBO26436.1 hypothetical protein AVEN_241149-1 [Araneus ventricosus]